MLHCVRQLVMSLHHVSRLLHGLCHISVSLALCTSAVLVLHPVLVVVLVVVFFDAGSVPSLESESFTDSQQFLRLGLWNGE